MNLRDAIARLMALVLFIVAVLIVAIGPNANAKQDPQESTGTEEQTTLVDDSAAAPDQPDAAASDDMNFNLPQDSKAHKANKAKAAATDPEVDGVENDAAGPSPDATVNFSFTGINRATGLADPPDTIAGASSTRVLEGVNRALRLSTTGGAPIQTLTLNSFFGASSPGLFDPKVYFDRNSIRPRFYVTALQVSGRGNVSTADDFSRIWIAVSRSSDPASLASGSWCRYFTSGIRDGGTANASWADYPGLGVGADAVALTTNQFRFTNDSFTKVVLRAFRKNVMNNNAASCPAVGQFVFERTDAFTIQPAQHYSNPSSFTATANPLYLVSTGSGGGTSYRVWRLRNVSATPSLSFVSLSGVAYTPPPDSPGGSGAKIDTGDTRTLQAAGLGNLLYSVNTTGCQFTSGTAIESCFRWVRFGVGQNSSGGLIAAVGEQRTIGGGNDQFYHHPGVAVNNSGETATSFQANLSSTAYRLSGRVATRAFATGSGFFGTTFTTGTCALATGFDSKRGAYRSGDYTGAQTATDTDSFWVAAERAEVIGSTCTWGTRIARVTNP